jgi:hypothetical protein
MRIVNRALLLVAAILATSPAAFSAEAPLCIGDEAASTYTTAAAKSPIVNAAAAVLGTTPAEIDARFAGVIEQNFRTGDPNKLVHALTSHELADLATLYKQRSGGATTLLELMAKHVDADGLTLVASAFGQTETAAAAASYAPRAVYTAFKSLAAREAAVASPAIAQAENVGDAVVTDAAAPTVDMTPYEIYLDFRTAPNGSLSILGALYEAGVFITFRVSIAYGAGYATGTVVNDLIETYDPDLETTIGGTVSEMVQQVQNAITAAAQGELEESFDNLFGIPISYNNPGDFDVTEEMADLSDPNQCV